MRPEDAGGRAASQAGKQLGKLAGKAAKKAGRFLAGKALILIGPYIPVIALFLVVFMLVFVLIAATYAAMTPQGALTGVEPSPEDEKIQQRYEELCSIYNVKNTWMVSGESSPGNPWHPGKGNYHIEEMIDRYGNDVKLKLNWGIVHATALFWAYVNGESEIPEEVREKAAEGLQPYYYYKESEVTTCTTDEDGKKNCNSRTVYLLVEANTIEGHYQYHYEWVTETRGEGGNKTSVRYETLKDTRQIAPDRWQRLENFLQEFYRLKPRDDMALNRMMVWEAGRGFDEHKEWLEWLMNNYDVNIYASSSMIPPELMPLFKEAEDTHGIPWWFLAAVAYKESSFDSHAVNTKTGCFGLMQVSEDNWAHYAPRLGFNTERDKDNPRAQILMGAYLFRSCLGEINWEHGWENATLDALAFYGGFRGSNALKRCRREYAEPIWGLAKRFRDISSAWPVPGHTEITSYFGWRIHPILGTKKFHDGIDIKAPQGAPVTSVSAGIVTTADEKGGYGNCVIIKDSQHFYLYGHLERIGVKVDQSVQPGQQLGTVGSTGVSTGPHLHFGVKDLAGDYWIDPLLVVQP
jgi:hypothetical protein